MTLAKRVDPVSGRRRRPRREGDPVRGPPRRRRPRGAGGALRRRGADELVFLDITATVEGRAATLDVDRTDRRAGVHPPHGRWRRPGGGGRGRAPASRRRQGRRQQRGRPRPIPARTLRGAIRHAVHGRRDRREAHRRLVGGVRRRRPHADRTGRGRVGGRGRGAPRRRRGAAHLDGPGWNRRGATISACSVRSAAPSASRSSRAAARARSSTSATRSSRADPTRCSRRPGSTSSSSRSRWSRNTWHRGVYR